MCSVLSFKRHAISISSAHAIICHNSNDDNGSFHFIQHIFQLSSLQVHISIARNYRLPPRAVSLSQEVASGHPIDIRVQCTAHWYTNLSLTTPGWADLNYWLQWVNCRAGRWPQCHQHHQLLLFLDQRAERAGSSIVYLLQCSCTNCSCTIVIVISYASPPVKCIVEHALELDRSSGVSVGGKNNNNCNRPTWSWIIRIGCTLATFFIIMACSRDRQRLVSRMLLVSIR